MCVSRAQEPTSTPIAPIAQEPTYAPFAQGWTPMPPTTDATTSTYANDDVSTPSLTNVTGEHWYFDMLTPVLPVTYLWHGVLGANIEWSFLSATFWCRLRRFCVTVTYWPHRVWFSVNVWFKFRSLNNQKRNYCNTKIKISKIAMPSFASSGWCWGWKTRL